MKTIILATDYSYNADNALEYAGALAAYTNSKIILFNAFQLPLHASNSLISPDGYDELVDANEKRLQNMALKTSQNFRVVVESTTSLSIITEALGALVSQVSADVVVMGMHSNDWSDKILGNTATAVIRAATFPILIVPENAVFTGIEKILYAFDTNNLCLPTQLSLLSEFANSFHAEVEVMHVEARTRKATGGKQSAEKVNTKLEVALAGIDHYYKDVEEEDVAEGIEKGIEEANAKLLVMVPHKLTFWESLLNISTTRTMALRTRIPLLVLPSSPITRYN